MQGGGKKEALTYSLHSRLWWIGGISQMGILRVRRSGVQEEADGAG